MDVLNHENAPFYWMRDELYSFAIDLAPGRDGADALARVLERWVARLTGARSRSSRSRASTTSAGAGTSASTSIRAPSSTRCIAGKRRPRKTSSASCFFSG
jgi:hypothetical protein